MKLFTLFDLPTNVFQEKNIFVCGGEDFKMYKYDYLTGNEIGKRFKNPSVTGKLKIKYIFRILQGPFWTSTCSEF